MLKRLRRNRRAEWEAKKSWDIRHGLVIEALSQSSEKAATLVSDLNVLANTSTNSSDKAELANLRAIRNARSGRISQSIRWWRQALRLLGKKSHSRYYHANLAQIFALKGENAAAQKHFRNALALNPGFSLARRGLEALQDPMQR